MADDTLVTIVMPKGKFEYLKLVLSNHKDFIHKLSVGGISQGVSKVLKESLIKDTHIITTIIDTGKK